MWSLIFYIIIISQVYCTMLETVQLNQFAALEPASQNVEQIYICHHTIVWWLHVTLELDG